MKKFIALAAVLLMVVPLLLPAAALADDGCRLAIIADYDDVPLTGVEIKAYRVAYIRGTQFVMTDDFALCPITPYPQTVDEWNEMAQTFEGFLYGSGITPTAEGLTDENGELRLEGLSEGLYFIGAAKLSQDGITYISLPFFVNLEKGEEKEAKVKLSPEPEDEYVYRKVLKIWDDGGSRQTRPESVTVILYCDGVEYDRVVLNEECRWRHIWKLPTGHHWSVYELPVENYSCTVELDGITFTLINTPPTTPPPSYPPELPQTGLTWWPVPVLAVFGIGFLAIAIIKRHEDDYDEE